VVTIATETAVDALVGIFAAWQVDACPAVLDPTLSVPERINVDQFLQPAAAIGAASTWGDQEVRRIEGSGLDAPALILLTSGTTGKPKAVLHSHRALLARIALNRAYIGDDRLSRTLLTLPLHFGHGLIGNALTALFSGATLVLHPRGPALASNLAAVIDTHRITFFSSVPSFWPLVLRLDRTPQGKSLRRVHVGSAPLSSELWKQVAGWCDTEVVNCYGITETANWIGGQSSADGVFHSGRVGRPWGGSYAVTTADSGIQLSGEGEILVRSPSVMMGYLDRPDLTAKALHGGWFRTGDTGRLNPDGSLELSGRIKDEINRAGQKIQPADVDMVIEAHHDVQEACSFGLLDPVSGEAVAVAVVLKAGATLDQKALRTWCKERLRPSAVPERWFFVEALPKTSRGKISRNLVRDSVAGQ